MRRRQCGVDPEKRVRELSEEDVAGIRAEVEGGEYLIEGDCRRFNSMAVKRLVDISCYRGRRHVAGLPVRGQRILELGCGTGVGGIGALLGGAKRVVLTDFEDSLLDNLSKSGEINAGAGIELRGYESPGEGGPWEEGELGRGNKNCTCPPKML